MQDFAAIDFETINERRSSVCSIGVVIVSDGKIVDKFYSLIQPLLTIIHTDYGSPWVYTEGHRRPAQVFGS